MASKTLIVIAGPTASGKTDIGIAIAQYLNTEIISFDSRQFYKELHIGTARPLEIEWQGIPHHFLGHMSIQNKYSIADFEKEALIKLQSLFKVKDQVVAVGGSGLYLNALLYGLDQMPDVDERIRVQLNADFNSKGIKYIQDLLQLKDPDYFKEVDIQNPQRMIRALEIVLSTGQAFSSFRKNKKTQRAFSTDQYAVQIDRALLYERIHQRVDKMIAAGLLNEAEKHLQFKDVNALNTVGYKELWPYFEAHCTLAFAIDKIKQHTRNFAKRQITWFKHQDEYQWLSTEAILKTIKSKYDQN